MKYFNSHRVKLFGDVNQIGSERYFVTITCLVSSVFLFLLCIIHFFMGLKAAPVYYAGGSAMIIFGLYFLVRYGTCLFIPKLLLSVLGLVMLDFTWYSKFLSNGPVLFFYPDLRRTHTLGMGRESIDPFTYHVFYQYHPFVSH